MSAWPFFPLPFSFYRLAPRSTPSCPLATGCSLCHILGCFHPPLPPPSFPRQPSMSSSTAIALSLLIAGLAYLAYKLRDVGRRESYLPPGPPTVRLLGNLNIFPKEYVHYTCVSTLPSRLRPHSTDLPLPTLASPNGPKNMGNSIP